MKGKDGGIMSRFCINLMGGGDLGTTYHKVETGLTSRPK